MNSSAKYKLWIADNWQALLAIFLVLGSFGLAMIYLIVKLLGKKEN